MRRPGESETAPQFVTDSLHPSVNVSAFAEVSTSPFTTSVPRTPNSFEIVTVMSDDIETGPVTFFIVSSTPVCPLLPFLIAVPASNSKASTLPQIDDVP